jgi:peptidoglycan/LPS O-acetylase OafA/YrhL
MRGSRALQVATIAGSVVLIAYVIDLLAGSDLSRPAATTGRVAVVIAAMVCAGVVYQSWSVRRQHTPRDHAAAAAGLLGGALAASSAFSAPAGQIFGNSLTAAAGVAGLALALVGSRPTTISTEGRR